MSSAWWPITYPRTNLIVAATIQISKTHFVNSCLSCLPGHHDKAKGIRFLGDNFTCTSGQQYSQQSAIFFCFPCETESWSSLHFSCIWREYEIQTKASNTDLLMIGLTAGLNSPNNLCNPSECGVSGIFHFSDNQLPKKNLIRPKKCGSVFAEKHI